MKKQKPYFIKRPESVRVPCGQLFTNSDGDEQKCSYRNGVCRRCYYIRSIEIEYRKYNKLYKDIEHYVNKAIYVAVRSLKV